MKATEFCQSDLCAVKAEPGLNLCWIHKRMDAHKQNALTAARKRRLQRAALLGPDGWDADTEVDVRTWAEIHGGVR